MLNRPLTKSTNLFALPLFIRFGSGYTLTLRAISSSSDQKKTKKTSGGDGDEDDDDGSGVDSTTSEAVAKLKEMVARTFPLAELKEEHYNQVAERS